jgi:hypothetical protein
MAPLDRANRVSIAEASRLGVAALVREAEAGCAQVLLRHDKPIAAVVSIEWLDRLQELEHDLLDVILATARMATAGPRRHSLDEVLARFGYTREQLG